MTETEKKKRSFRNSKKWKDFRKQMYDKQKGRCFITGSKLPKRAELHHCDLKAENYENLDEDNFVMLMPSIHECVHTLYRYYKKDKTVIDRLVAVLDKMEKLNKGE